MPTPPNILGVPLANLIGTALGGKALPATLTKFTPAGYSSSNPGGGLQKTPVTYGCRAFVTTYKEMLAKGEQTRVMTGTIMILLSTVTGKVTPVEGDRITMVWPDGNTRLAFINMVEIDPAGAQATCTVTA